MNRNPLGTRLPGFVEQAQPNAQPMLLKNYPNAFESFPASLQNYRRLPEAIIIRPSSSDPITNVWLTGLDGQSGSVDVFDSTSIHIYTIENPAEEGEDIDVILLSPRGYNSLVNGQYYNYRVGDGSKTYYTEAFVATDLSCPEKYTTIEWRDDCFTQGIDYERPTRRFTHKITVEGIPSRPEPINEVEVSTNNLNEREVVSKTTNTVWRLQARMTIDELDAIGKVDGHSFARMTWLGGSNLNNDGDILEISVVSTDYSSNELWPIVTLEVKTRSNIFDDACCADIEACNWGSKDTLLSTQPTLGQSGSAPTYTISVSMLASNFSPAISNGWVEVQYGLDQENWDTAEVSEGVPAHYTPAEIESGVTFEYGNAFPAQTLSVRLVYRDWNCEYPSQIETIQLL